MNGSLTRFLAEITAICSRHFRNPLAVPLHAVAIALFAQLLRLEQERISHRSHPLRVLDHMLLGLPDVSVSPPVSELALGLASMGHDLAGVRKITSSDVASHQEKDATEAARRSLRLLHEAEGTAALIRAVIAANTILKEDGQPLICAGALEIAARVAAVHDTPSLRSPLPLSPDSVAGQALALFVQADGITMIECDNGLLSEIPLGPMVEPWSKGKTLNRDTVAEQAIDSVKSLRSRLQAAFGRPPALSLPECFANKALRQRARDYLAAWSTELGVDLDEVAGSVTADD